MRRMLLLACAAGVLASVAVVAFASSPPAQRTAGPQVSGRTTPEPLTGPFAVAARGGPGPAPHAGGAPARAHGHGPGGRHAVVREIVLNDVAKRLGVARGQVERAVGQVRAGALAHAVDRGLISVEQRLAIEACAARRTCDRSAARAAVLDLKNELTPSAREEYKTAMLKRFAWAVDRPAYEVELGLRAELEVKLGVARRVGWITRRGADRALACFDAPARCDLAGLRRELRVHDRRGPR